MVSHHPPPPYSDIGRPSAPSVAASAPTLAHRASSVTSGRSATRRHRHSRNHHGSNAHLPQNEFPIFSQTGDVEILIKSADGRKENRYLLHRLTLSQCSGFFEAGTRAQWNGRPGAENAPGATFGPGLARINENDSVTAGSSSRANSTERRPSFDLGRRRWHYELDWEAAGDNELPMLVQKDDGPSSIFGDGRGSGPPPVHSKPPTSNESFFRSVSNFSTLNLNERNQPSTPADSNDEVLKDYDNLLRTMYHYAPSLDTINIATAYSECKALLNLADMYDALEIVGSRVDHHLLRFGSRLYKQIAKYPPSYLKLGYLARSRTIFTEALVHVVGQWPLAAPQLRGQLDNNVLDLIEDKVDDLRELEERVQSKLWRLNITTSRGERVTPSNDFLAFLALSLFRQWLAESTTPAVTGILRDASRPLNGTTTTTSSAARSSSHHIVSQRVAPQAPVTPLSAGRIYRLLGSTDSTSYLAREDLKRFLKQPNGQLGVELYTRDNLKRFERRMEEIKNQARDAVQPLMRNFLQLDLRDLGATGLGYLVCTRLEGTDLPWDE